jgi:hypothetical protein
MAPLPQHLAIVVQGQIGPGTAAALARYRAIMPKARIVVSAYEACAVPGQILREQGLLDELVIVADPGPLPSTVRSPTAGPNNLNRMLATTQAGLQRAGRPYVLKVRSDASVDPLSVVLRWRAEADENRLLFASRYTRHPFGINAYLFHPSDWITFGTLSRTWQYWGASPMGLEDATYFEHTPMQDQATATARRFRARLTQEQWLCTQYAAALGYPVPERLAQRWCSAMRASSPGSASFATPRPWV